MITTGQHLMYGCATTIVWGTANIDHWRDCPITNLPSGTIRVRRRFRQKQVGQAFVLRPGSIEQYRLDIDGEALRLGMLMGVNTR